MLYTAAAASIRTMFRRECPRCHRKGFVRTERVFKGGLALTASFCGACTHTWEQEDGPPSSTKPSFTQAKPRDAKK